MELLAEGLTKRFGETVALDRVSFKIDKKGCYGYLGPNGAGKTTTMKIFTNLLRPSGGKAYINGVDVNREPVRALRSVGSLVEDPEPYGYLSVGEFIEYAAKIRGASKPDLDGLKSQLDLPELNRRCSRLSKGQRRRVYIAALLAQNAEILMLDEPSSGLDPKEAQILRDTIRELKRDRIVLLSSHLLYEVNIVCDYLYFIYKGKIVEEGKLEDVSKKFTSKALRIEFYSRPENLDGLGYRFETEGERYIIVYYDGSDAQRREILDKVYPLGVRSFADAELGLEEAYRQVIG
ncbi:MAG: ABC transporter ATP-binding protein [Thermoprotei archaeon]